MNTVTLAPASKQLYQVTQNSHPRISIRRVIWVRFLRWIEKSPLQTIGRRFLKTGLFLFVLLAYWTPSFAMGIVTSTAKWNSYKIPLFLALLFVMLNVKRVKPRRKPNQNSYHGLPIDELASFLIDEGRFTREDAMNRFGISKEKHAKFAAELEKNQVLCRGENNARVLGTISREQLVRQLRDNFPLALSNGEWVERKGSFHLFLRDQERKEHREQEKVERMERKAKRLKKEIQEYHSNPFISRELVA